MIYALFRAKIENPSALASYRDGSAEALARHGGAVVTATRQPTALDGAPDMPDMAALLSFPTKEAAQAWINDPDLSALHTLRRSAGTTEILLLA